jgi:uncharacterized membrane protein/protein-disulfide isomerase
MSRARRFSLLACALLGLGATSASTYVHYRLATNPDYASFCDVSAGVSCTQAYLSPYGSFLGVPVALEGVLFFLVVLVLAGVAGGPASRARESVPAYVFVLSLAGLGFSAYLAWASYAVLQVFCLLCAITYLSVLGLVAVSLGAERVPMTTLPRRAARDARTLVSTPRALALAIFLAASGTAALLAFPAEGPPRPAPAQESVPALAPDVRAQLEAWWNVQPKAEIPVPAGPDAKVQIVMFSDYQCPGCRAAHETLKRVLARYDRTAVELAFKHYPLEPECNPNVPQGNHLAACEAAAAYVMARGSGFQQKLDDWLFDNQATLTRDAVRKAALEIAGIKDFDARYDRALQEVKTDAGLGGFVQVRSTPTVFLNGRMIAGNGKGLLPAPHVDALIDIELKKPK